MRLEVRGEVFTWRGPAPHHFVRIDGDPAEQVQETATAVTYGWGMVPVRVWLGATTWTTSLWPKDGGYLVPVKAEVRRREGVEVGDVVDLEVEIAL
ncbi:MAG: DUF1905 domain-containing protein [Actinobacteria bacterium]|jgi:hypothetical protein|nr:DUF1905 domain-containing protein [Actinomycetota bacterium]